MVLGTELVAPDESASHGAAIGSNEAVEDTRCAAAWSV